MDAVSGKDYGYRREWIRRRMEALASVFGVDVLTYAVLSNHLHLVLWNRPDVVAEWSDVEVAIRWLKVYPGRRIEEHLGEPSAVDVKALVADPQRMKVIRERLTDISWFMRALSEPIARMANWQDNCTGRFWEGRFKAQRITDDIGLLACAMYVDLNPIRAAVVGDIEHSRHTSAYDRLKSQSGATIEAAAHDLVPASREENARLQQTKPTQELKAAEQAKRKSPAKRRIRRDAWLAPLTFKGEILASDPETNKSGVRASNRGFLDLNLKDYLQLLRWTARKKSNDTA